MREALLILLLSLFIHGTAAGEAGRDVTSQHTLHYPSIERGEDPVRKGGLFDFAQDVHCGCFMSPVPFFGQYSESEVLPRILYFMVGDAEGCMLRL